MGFLFKPIIMEVYLGLFIPSLILFFVAIFLQTHKYRAINGSVSLAKECSKCREKIHLKRWQLILGIIVLFIPFINIATSFVMFLTSAPEQLNDEFIYIDNPKYKKLINYLKQDI